MPSRWFFLSVLVLCPRIGAAATPEEVARLRQEVDRLTTELEDVRRRARDELSSLRAEKAELERQVRLERVRSATLRELEREATAAAVALSEDLEARTEPAREALTAAREYLDAALPYRLDERRTELDRVALALDSGEIARAMSRLWRFVQQEDAMGGEVTLSRQSVELGGTERLADVARIGMALLYFRSPDGTLAHAVRDDGDWQIVELSDPRSKTAVGELFRSLENNQRLGSFELVIPRGLDDAP